LIPNVAFTVRNLKEHRMLRVFAFLQNLPVHRDDRGMTATEYALLLALVGVTIIAGLHLFGPALRRAFASFATNF
jgi:Flp pilus assembly pilin Flp